jgi:hypothetical protein
MISANQIREIHLRLNEIKKDLDTKSDFLESRTKTELLEIFYAREQDWRNCISDLYETIFELQNMSANLMLEKIRETSFTGEYSNAK